MRDRGNHRQWPSCLCLFGLLQGPKWLTMASAGCGYLHGSRREDRRKAGLGESIGPPGPNSLDSCLSRFSGFCCGARSYNTHCAYGGLATLREWIVGACVLLLAGGASLAQEHEHLSGEHLGVVHFSTSCNEAGQREFDRAMALLHSFQFSKAIQGFNAALKNDPTCGISYWGIALSQWSNPFATGMKDPSQLQAGRASVERGKAADAKTDRERAYLAAVALLYQDFEHTLQRTRLLAYRDAMSELSANYPSDDEAQIFYALAIAASEDPADKTYAGRLKAGTILESLFKSEPDHPGLAHYIIHTYDVPSLAPRALRAARRYSEI